MISDSDEVAGGARGRLPAVAATLVAPLLIYWIVRTAALGLGGAAAVTAGALPPAEYSAMLKGLMRASQNPSFKVPAGGVELARSGLAAAPLSHEPFFIVAKAEEQAGRRNRALLLMEEVRRRRPNHVATRAQLAVYYGQSANYDGFMTEMDYVLGRSEAAQRPLLPELAKTIANPDGRRALAKLLAREPRWREGFFLVASERNVDPDDAADLVDLIRARKQGGSMVPEQRFQIQTLVAAGRYRRAKEVWDQAFKSRQRSDNLVFNPDFRGSTAPPPFNWTLQDTEVGRATLAAAGEAQPALEVEYFGNNPIVLADQMLALAAGRYRLTLSSEGEGGANGGRLLWRVVCLPDGRELTRIQLRLQQTINVGSEASFVVPAVACAGQRLQLVGEPGDVATPLRARISKVGIRRHD